MPQLPQGGTEIYFFSFPPKAARDWYASAFQAANNKSTHDVSLFFVYKQIITLRLTRMRSAGLRGRREARFTT